MSSNLPDENEPFELDHDETCDCDECMSRAEAQSDRARGKEEMEKA